MPGAGRGAFGELDCLGDRRGAAGSRAAVLWHPLPTDKSIAEGNKFGAGLMDGGGDPCPPDYPLSKNGCGPEFICIIDIFSGRMLLRSNLWF